MAGQSTTVPDRGVNLFEQLLDRINGLPSALRQATVDQQWAEIPLRVVEAAYVPAAAGGGVVNVNARSTILELIETVVASLPAGGGLLQLGPTVLIPLPAGVTAFSLPVTLGPQDTRSLTLAAGNGGPAALVLCGKQIPEFGVIG